MFYTQLPINSIALRKNPRSAPVINIRYYSQMDGLLSILVYKARASEIDRGTSTEVQRLQEAVHPVES